jgi:hypothetical protein
LAHRILKIIPAHPLKDIDIFMDVPISSPLCCIPG